MLPTTTALLDATTSYLILLAMALAPFLIIITVFKSITFLLDRLGDSAFDTIQRKRRFKKMGNDVSREEMLHMLRTLTPKEFEYYIAGLYENAGYFVKVIGMHGKGDGGIDIIVAKDGVKSYIQCKKWFNEDVGVAQVRDFYGAVADDLHLHPKSTAFVITTSGFTDDAKKFAKNHRIELRDSEWLIDTIFGQEIKGDKVQFDGDVKNKLYRNTPPACPACKRKLVWRSGEYGDFIGCSGYPKCRYIFNKESRKI